MTEDDRLNAEALLVHIANAEALKRGALAMWTVYDRPKDYPDGFVARMHEISQGATVATNRAIFEAELDHVRRVLDRAGLIRMQRHDDDEPQIVETWI